MQLADDIRFDKVWLRLAQREVFVDGHRLQLGNRAFDLLVALIERRDRVVGKAELLVILWPGREVGDGNLHVHVSTLRRVLGADMISTIQGQGYRFVPKLYEAHADLAAELPGRDSSTWATAPPKAGALIGRDDEVRLAIANLRPGRCVTLVGPGGVGKTRLAREVTAIWSARQATPDRRSVWLDVSVSPDLQTLLAAVAYGLELPAPSGSTDGDDASAVEWLARRSANWSGLLVLDNVEHLQLQVAAISDALCRTPCKLCLLVTSRHRLDAKAAWELALRGLDTWSVVEGETNAGPAVELFCSRMAMVDLTFRQTDMATQTVESICRRLDGLPLALELAAARVPLLGLEGVVRALDSQLSAFVDGSKRRGDRHLSLLAVLEWSASFLDRDEQTLFAALAVMQGSFTLAEAASVASFDNYWHFASCFDGLLRKSMIVAELGWQEPRRPTRVAGTAEVGAGEVRRWRMLETTRQFAHLRLRNSGSETAVLHRHAESFASQAEELHGLWLGGKRTEREIEASMDRLIGNCSAALDWCCGDEHGPDAQRARLAVRILTTSARALHHRGLLQKARRWGEMVASFWLDAATRADDGVLCLSASQEAGLLCALVILRPHGLESSVFRMAHLRRAGELLGGLDEPGAVIDVQLALALLAGRAGADGVALNALAAARSALPSPAPARLRARVAEAQMRLSVLLGIGSAPEEALVEEILADLESAGDGNSRVAALLRIEQAEKILLAGRHRAAIRSLTVLCEDFGSGRYGWEVWLAPFDALAHAQLQSRDLDGAANSLRRSIVLAGLAGYWGEVGSIMAWYLCMRGRHRAAMELYGATEAHLESIGYTPDRLQSTALGQALTLARRACRSVDITRWRAGGKAPGAGVLQQMLGEGDSRFAP